MVSLSNLLNHFQSAVWLPWMVLCWEHLLDTPSWKHLLTLVLVLLCALLAGSPEIYFFSMGLLLIDRTRVCFLDHLGLTRMILLLLTANALVAALGMVQFLPTAELLLHSRRDRPIPFQEATYWSLNPVSLAGIVFPDKEAMVRCLSGCVFFSLVKFRFFEPLPRPAVIRGSVGVGLLCSWKDASGACFGDGFIASGARNIYAGIRLFVRARRRVSSHTVSGEVFFSDVCLSVFVVLKGLAALHSVNDSRHKFPVYIF